MSKKVKIFNPFSKSRIISTVAILSFVGMILLWLYFISFIQYVNEQNKINAEQVFKLSVQNAQQQYCIENAVKPCTQDAINAHAESMDKK